MNSISIKSWLVGILVALIGMSVCRTALAGGDLPGLKAAYEEQTAKIRTDCDGWLKNLNQQYVQGLETLDAQFKRAGDLDSLLIVRREVQRFKQAETLTQSDIVETPASLASFQRSYLASNTRIGTDRTARTAKLTTAYAGQLEQLKSVAKQQGNLSAALEVQKELERLRQPGDRPTLTETAPPQPPQVGVPGSPAMTNTENRAPATVPPLGPNEGTAEIINRNCQLPEIGRLVFAGMWGTDDGEHGIELFAENPAVKLESDFVAYGNVAKTIAVFKVGDGRTAIYQLGDVRYEVKVSVQQDHTYLNYKRL